MDGCSTGSYWLGGWEIKGAQSAKQEEAGAKDCVDWQEVDLSHGGEHMLSEKSIEVYLEQSDKTNMGKGTWRAKMTESEQGEKSQAG